MKITLNEEQLQKLESFLVEVPFKFSNPILQMLGALAQEQNPKSEEVEVEG